MPSIALLDSGTYEPTYGASYINSVTLSAGATMLLVGFEWQYGGNAITGISYNGVAGTLIANFQNPQSTSTALYAIPAPATGAAHNLQITGGNNYGPCAVIYASFSHTSSTIGASANQVDLSGTDVRQTLTGVAGTTSYLVMFEGAMFGTMGTPITADSPWSIINGMYDSTNSIEVNMVGGLAPAAGTNTLGFSGAGGGHMDVVAVELKPAPSNQTITCTGVTSAFASGSATLTRAITAAVVSASFSTGAATVARAQSITAAPTSATSALGSLTVSLAAIAAVVSSAFALGVATVGQSVTAAAVSVAAAFGLASVSNSISASTVSSSAVPGSTTVVLNSGQSVTATSALAAAFALGAVTFTQPSAPSPISSGTTSAAFTIGSGSVTQPSSSTITANVTSAGYALGPVALVQSTTASPLSAAFSLGAASIALTQAIISGPVPAVFTLGSATISTPTVQSVAVDPATAAFSLGTSSLTQASSVVNPTLVFSANFSSTTSTPTSTTYNLNGASLLVVEVAYYGPTPPTISFGGVSLTALGSPFTASFGSCQLYYLNNPPTGAQTFTVTPATNSSILASYAVFGVNGAAAGSSWLGQIQRVSNSGMTGTVTATGVSASSILLGITEQCANSSTVPGPPPAGWTSLNSPSASSVTWAAMAEQSAPAAGSDTYSTSQGSNFYGTYVIMEVLVGVPPTPQTLTASQVSSNYSLGPVSIAAAQNQNIATTQLVGLMATGSASITTASIVTAGPVIGLFSSGSASVSTPFPQTLNAVQVTATFTIGAVSVFKVAPNNIYSSGVAAGFALGNVNVAAGIPVVAGSVSASFALGSVSIARGLEPLSVAPLSGSFALGAVAVQLGNNVIPDNYLEANFQVNLDIQSDGTTQVVWFTYDGTAVAGVDYAADSGTLHFPLGSMSASIQVAYRAPAASAQPKTFSVVLTSPYDANIQIGICEFTIPSGSGVTVVVPPPSTQPITITAIAAASAIFSVGTVTVVETGVTPPPTPSTMTFLTATGSKLFDENNVQFIPRSCDWFGIEASGFPGGLYNRAYKTITVDGVVHEGICDQIKRHGFNSVRMGFCQNILWGKDTMTPATWSTTTGMRPTDAGYVDYMNFNLNPDLFVAGTTAATGSNAPQPFLTCLEILDKIINYFGSIGIRVIMDMHCLSWNDSDQMGNSRATSPTPGGSQDFSTNNPLNEQQWIYTKRWYTTVNPGDPGMNGNVINEYRNEQQCIDAWVAMATRYASQPAMMGCDIINEPAGTTWDDDPNTGLPAFFERVGAAIHAVNPKVQIVCEGPFGNLDFGQGAYPFGGFQQRLLWGTQFSGNFSGVATRPVTLGIPGKVIYSPHHYGSFGGEALGYLTADQIKAWNNPTAKGLANQWNYDENFPQCMPKYWSIMWGFVAEQNIAPLWIGETGGTFSAISPVTQAQVDADTLWMTELNAYMRTYNIGFSWFSINPDNPGSAYGLLVSLNSDGTASPVNSTNAWTTEINSFQKPFVDMLVSPTLNPKVLERLSTSGGKIINEDGTTVELKSQNWFGFEVDLLPTMTAQNGFDGPGRAFKTITYTGATTDSSFPGGAITNATTGQPMYTHNQVFEGILDEILRLGYNSVRMPLCEDISWPGALPDSNGNINGYLNPEMTTDGGASGFYDVNMRPAIELLDLIVGYAQKIGLYIIVDLHSLAPQGGQNGAGANGGLWYTTATPGATGVGITNTACHTGTAGDHRSEQQAMDFFTMIAERYKGYTAFAGIDLINEPFNGTWDLNATTGLVGFYNRAIATITAVNPKVLLICEGTSGPVNMPSGGQEYPAYAGNLSGVRTTQVTAPANRVVYSTHEYCTFNAGRFTSGSFPATLSPYWDAAWGFIVKGGIAPVWIGEFSGDFRDPSTLGTNTDPNQVGTPQSQATQASQWMDTMSAYIIANDVSWAFFAFYNALPLPSSTEFGYLSSPIQAQDQTTTDPRTSAKLANMLAHVPA